MQGFAALRCNGRRASSCIARAGFTSAAESASAGCCTALSALPQNTNVQRRLALETAPATRVARPAPVGPLPSWSHCGRFVVHERRHCVRLRCAAFATRRATVELLRAFTCRCNGIQHAACCYRVAVTVTQASGRRVALKARLGAAFGPVAQCSAVQRMPQRDGQAWLGADPHQRNRTLHRTRHNRKQAQPPSVGRRRTRGLASTARRCRRRAWRPSRSSSTVRRPAAPARSSHPPAHSCDLDWPASPRAPTRACTSCVRGTRSHGPASGPDQRTCTQVSPKAGFALTTPFRIRCARWADIDAPLRYEFGTRLGRVGSPLFLSVTLAPTGELYLPSGCAPSCHVCTGTGLAPSARCTVAGGTTLWCGSRTRSALGPSRCTSWSTSPRASRALPTRRCGCWHAPL